MDEAVQRRPRDLRSHSPSPGSCWCCPGPTQTEAGVSGTHGEGEVGGAQSSPRGQRELWGSCPRPCPSSAGSPPAQQRCAHSLSHWALGAWTPQTGHRSEFRDSLNVSLTLTRPAVRTPRKHSWQEEGCPFTPTRDSAWLCLALPLDSLIEYVNKEAHRLLSQFIDFNRVISTCLTSLVIREFHHIQTRALF